MNSRPADEAIASRARSGGSRRSGEHQHLALAIKPVHQCPCPATSRLASSWATSALTCLAVGAALDLGHDSGHDLAHVAGDVAPVSSIACATSAVSSVLGELLGQVGGDDLDLRLLLAAASVAAGSGVSLDRLAARLDLTRKHAHHLVVGRGRGRRFLGVVGSRQWPSAACRAAARRDRGWPGSGRPGASRRGSPGWRSLSGAGSGGIGSAAITVPPTAAPTTRCGRPSCASLPCACA